MRTPFPGMDPWLEHPDLWPDVHNSLIVAIRDALTPQVAPRYFVKVEARTTVLSGRDVERYYRPDVAVRAADQSALPRETAAVIEPRDFQQSQVVVPVGVDEIEETFLSIQEVTSRKLITAIEVHSPTNKKTRNARAKYLNKRRKLLLAKVGFVEINLLRGGALMPLENPRPTSDYRILICRPKISERADLLRFSVRLPIPSILIPLAVGEAEPILELNQILHALYERAHYQLDIDYQQPPTPPLTEHDSAWAADILAHRGGPVLQPLRQNGA